MGGSAPSRNPSSAPTEDILPEIEEAIAADAQKVFDRAEKAFADEDWLEAIAYYQHLRAKFSYNVPLTTQAEMRLADVAFARERWSEARTYYRAFLRFHPRHERADYAAFRAGVCTFHEMPEESFFFPPATEKDQTEARSALVAMREFVRQYPSSSQVPEARKIIALCEQRLAAHELYVAKFYAKRKKWAGTLLRADGLVRKYPESPLAPEALVLAIEAHAELKQPEEAQKAFEQLSALKPAAGLLSRGQAAAARAR